MTQLDLSIRNSALGHAVDAHDLETPAEQILSTARTFEAYLRGEQNTATTTEPGATANNGCGNSSCPVCSPEGQKALRKALDGFLSRQQSSWPGRSAG